MNSIFFPHRIGSPARRSALSILAAFTGMILLGLFPFSLCARAQNGGDSIAKFKALAADLSTERLDGVAGSDAQQEKALAYLDSIAIPALNGSASPDLDAANQRFAALTSHVPPVGENYRLVKLGGTPTAYALVVNFGLGGPAAVRIYADAAGRYALAARIDRFAQKDFLDSDIELVPVSMPDAVFVTVAGRTDDLATGLFSAWRFDGHGVVALWTSDLLQQSDYKADKDGFHMTYCGEPDPNHLSRCLKMTRDLYRIQRGEWKRVETSDFPVPNPPAK